MSEVPVENKLEYEPIAAGRRTRFSWRAFCASTLFLLLVSGVWESLRYIARVHETIGASGKLDLGQRSLLTLGPSKLAAPACLPILSGLIWQYWADQPRYLLARRRFVRATAGFLVLMLAALFYFALAPIVALDLRLHQFGPQTVSKLPIHFADAHELFTYLAQLSGEQTNAASVEAFIAGCEIDRTPRGTSQWVIAPVWGVDGVPVRGASGDGQYFVVRELYDRLNYRVLGFDLTAISDGNKYRFGNDGKSDTMDVYSHISAFESIHKSFRWKNNAWRLASEVWEQAQERPDGLFAKGEAEEQSPK